MESRQISRRRAMALGAVSGALLWASYFPLNFGFASWFALVPLLLVVRVASNRRGQLAAWTAGLVFFVPVLSWMSVAHPAMILAWLFLSIHCSIFLWFTVWLLWRLNNRLRLPFVIMVPLVWTAVEFFRGQLFGGFAWYFLGHSQHDLPALLQVADIGGELLLTFVVAMVNGLFVDVIFAARVPRKSAIVVGCVLIACFAYGSWRLSQNQFAEGPRVALLQGNLPQDLRNSAAGLSKKEAEAEIRKEKEFIYRHYASLLQRAARERPDLCVWSESSLPDSFYFLAPGASAEAIGDERSKWIGETQKEMTAIASWGFPHLLGVNSWDVFTKEKATHANSAILIDIFGNQRARYDKMHRVPFGEFVPLGDTLPWLQLLTPYEGEYSVVPGKEFTRFAIDASGKPYTFGTLICYEDADAQLARQYVKSPAVDFLVNISNDGWFKGWPEHEQHLAIARFRAVECRRAVVRAVNMGISAVIDSNGQVTNLPGPTWKESKAIEAVVTARVPIDDRQSIYSVAGDWLPWTCWIVILVLSFWPGRSR